MTPLAIRVYAIIASDRSEYDGDIKVFFPIAASCDEALELAEPNLPVSYQVTHCLENKLILSLLAENKLPISEDNLPFFRIGHLVSQIRLLEVTNEMQQSLFEKMQATANQSIEILKNTLTENQKLREQLSDQGNPK